MQGLNVFEGIAVNWIAGNLYWTHNQRGIIAVSRLDGSFEKTLFRDLKQPYGIAVEITHRCFTKLCSFLSVYK